MDEQVDSYFASQAVNPIISKDEVDIYRDPLNFDLDDLTFLDYAKRLKREADEYWNDSGPKGYTLSSRRAKLEAYYFGRQEGGTKKKRYSSKAQDNLVWEASSYLRAMALSQLPDITVKPGQDTDDSKKTADDISKIVTSDIQSRDRKRVLGLSFKHLPVYLTGIIKPFWNPQKGKFGDYDFKSVLPENITADFRAASNDVRDMDFVFETCENTVKELVMMFPEKEKDFYTELYKWGTFKTEGGNENNEKGMNTKVKYEEVWFKWYDHPKEEKDKKKWEEIIGVGWYFNGCLFRKIKHPYWDWSGTPQTFTYKLHEIDEDTYKKEKTPVELDQVKQSIMTNQPIEGAQTENIFHNHLDYPEFPYIFLGMEQWGKTPLDETSWIEQNLAMQQIYDKRNQQIDETIDRSRGKHVFSSSEGMTKDDVSNMDLSDPNQDILVDGDVTKVHNFIPGEQPSPAMIQTSLDIRERIFDKAGIHQSTRGQVNSDTAATNNQIAREGDFTRMDDFVDDTINYACEKMANWEMQFIKLFYTEYHMRRILGPDGKWLAIKLQRDLLDDGMEVVISASGSDKLKAEQRAMDMAKMKLIDPFRFYSDVHSSDPRGRTVALMNFLMNPQMYLLDIQNGGDGQGKNGLQAAAGQVNGAANQMQAGAQQGQQPQQGGQQGDPQALQDIMMIEQGQIPPPPTQVSPGYMQTFTQFMHSPQLEQLMQQFGGQFKQQLLTFAQAVAQLGQAGGQQAAPGQAGLPAAQPQGAAQFGGGGGNSPVGPLSQNPSPQNTSKISAIAGRR
jgi:hypothetical protein